MISIYGIKIDRSMDQITFSALLENVSAEKKERVGRYRRYEDKIRCMLGDLVVRYVLYSIYKLQMQDIEFIYNDYGKPMLKAYTNIDFSISHSGEWVLCAFDDSPIGIDVEVIGNNDYDIVKRYFHKKEWEEFIKKDEPEKNQFFYVLWTAKESYIKMVGKGMSIPLNSFSVLDGTVCLENSTDNISEKSYLESFNLDDNHMVTLCTNRTRFNKDIKILTINELLDFFHTINCPALI